MTYRKYGNVKATVDGLTFDSKAEMYRYRELRLLEQAGTIADLCHHPRYVLQDGFRDSDGKWQRSIVYEGDFEYVEGGKRICEDVKGVSTEAFMIKVKMMKRHYPGVELRLIDANQYYGRRR